ncbi:glycoside hydrolase family 43 protein [Bacteroidales bacterium]|nr:glycoside hydrolase family 43 protein [Bacteroidales bacterium]
MKEIKIYLILILFYCNNLTAQIHDNPYAAKANPDEKETFTNPVIPGFYSDPSVCRVGDDYYLITSTFEYYPGVPIFHSKDLVNWEQIGHCIHREDQLPDGIDIFAATLRYNKGTFYMITTHFDFLEKSKKSGNFYVTATNPAGPWSDPIWLDDVLGIDPDLFFDDDGKSYVISSPFILYEIDLETGKLLTEGKKIYHGAGGRYAEGPHIYKKDGYYYLLAAEGGTEEAHHVTIARSNTIDGPYIVNPANPILAHANAAGQSSLIQGVGHADIIQAHDDSWWMVFHGYRKSAQYMVHHILGRETCLAPVSWPKNGWPVVNGNGTITEKMTCPTLPLKPFPQKPTREDFDNELGLDWNVIQTLKKDDSFYALKDGALHLSGMASETGFQNQTAFVGQRLRHMHFEANTNMEFNPKNENEHAGMALHYGGNYFNLFVKQKGNDRIVFAELNFGSICYKSKEFILKPGPVDLRIEGKGNTFSFAYAQGGEFTHIESVDSRYMSSETLGWFTGVYVGLFATGKGKQNKAVASYDYFEYKEK